MGEGEEIRPVDLAQDRSLHEGRVEADEATYNLHILLRFDLERPLISGDLQPADVPGVWNETFTKYFGITPGKFRESIA